MECKIDWTPRIIMNIIIMNIIIMNTVYLLSPFAKDDSGTARYLLNSKSPYILLLEQHLAGQLASGTSGI